MRRDLERTTQRHDPEFNMTECREVIRQTIATIENFNQTKLEITEETNKNFSFERRKLIKGQWIDVKDTINQWLEAQVIDVQNNKAYIHYYGWGNRWDEWIDMNSERIKPFRTHTIQTSLKNYLSSVPNISSDTNINLEESSDKVFLDYFPILSKKNFSTFRKKFRSVL